MTVRFTDAGADDWYRFCIEQAVRAGGKGDHAAERVWWCLRVIDDCEIGAHDDPCTEAGYLALSEYYAYKLAS